MDILRYEVLVQWIFRILRHSFGDLPTSNIRNIVDCICSLQKYGLFYEYNYVVNIDTYMEELQVILTKQLETHPKQSCAYLELY